MDIRLYWEKVYWALAKRVFKRKQKTYEDWLAKGYTNQPLVSFIIAYIIHSGFISGYQNRYGDNLKPPTNVYHRMTA